MASAGGIRPVAEPVPADATESESVDAALPIPDGSGRVLRQRSPAKPAQPQQKKTVVLGQLDKSKPKPKPADKSIPATSKLMAGFAGLSK